MLGEVGLPFFVGARERVDTALDEAEAGRVATGFETELDERRVRVGWALAVGMLPAEREEVGWIQPFDPEVDDRTRLPAEAAVAARSGIELGGIGEPAGDVLGLGDHPPDDLDRGIDVDLTLYAIGGQVSPLIDLQLMVAYDISE